MHPEIFRPPVKFKILFVIGEINRNRATFEAMKFSVPRIADQESIQKLLRGRLERELFDENRQFFQSLQSVKLSKKWNDSELCKRRLAPASPPPLDRDKETRPHRASFPS